jgi:septal ring factor EnvC (AmiA/AmiB activator)
VCCLLGVLAEVEALQRENTALRAQVAQLLSTNQQMVSQLARLSERLDELLAAARRKGRKGTAEKKTLPAPVVAAEAQQAFDTRPQPPALPDVGSAKSVHDRSGKSGHPLKGARDDRNPR